MPAHGSTGRVRAIDSKSSRKPNAPLSAAQMRLRLDERAAAVPQPPASWMKETLPALLAQWGAFGGFVGRRKRKGRVLVEVCLVVMTVAKHDPGKRGIKRVPAVVRWKDGRRTYQLATDVQEIAQKVERHATNVLGPGDSVVVGTAKGAIGAAVLHPQAGPCVLTAGHVVILGGGAKGSPATIRSVGTDFPARVVDVRDTGTYDYAVIAPEPGVDCDNLFRNLNRIGPVCVPTARQFGEPLLFLSPMDRAYGLEFRGVGGQFQTPEGFFDDVIYTSFGTVPGQSGGTLIDSSQQVWGFLVGALGSQYSIFAPADKILRAAGVSLIEG